MKKNWSKKFLTAALTSSMLFSMGAANSFAVTGDQVAKDKVYTGSGRVTEDPNSVWRGYDISLKMEVKDGVIKSIECTPAANMDRMNSGYVDLTRMQLATLVGKPATISSVNGLVDSNTGATYSLKGAKKIAVKMMQDAEAKENETVPVNPGHNDNPNPNPGNNNNPTPGTNTDPKTGIDAIADNDYIYGKINLAYADFYYGELNNLKNGIQKMDLNAADKAASLRAPGQYDAVTSATKIKSKRFPTTYFEEKENGVEILGIKDANVAIRKSLYVEAMKAIKEGKSSKNPLLNLVKNFKANEDPAQATYEYKVLNGDGTLSATTTQEVLDPDAKVTVKTGSVWGHYLVNVDSKKMPKVDEIEGIIIKTSDGKQYGMEHLENIWLRPNEFSFAVKKDFVEPHGNTVDYKRHEDLQGKRITQIRYLVRDKADLVINTNVLCKTLNDEKYGATIKDAEFKDGVTVTSDIKTPAGSNYKLAAIYKGRNTLEQGKDYTVSGNKISIKETEKTGMGTYTVVYEDEKYADIETSFNLRSKYQDGDVKLADNKLTLPEGLSQEDYASTISTVFLDGKRVKGRDLLKTIFKEDGSVNFDAKLKNKDGSETPIFKKGAAGIYTIELKSDRHPSVKSMVVAPGTKDTEVQMIDAEHAIKKVFLGYNVPGYNLNDYDYEAYDISMRDGTDSKVQPDAGKKVKVQIELKKVDPEKLVILHDKGNKQLEEIKDFKIIEGKKIEFEVDHFSNFFFANKKPTSSVVANSSSSQKASPSNAIKPAKHGKHMGKVVKTSDSSSVTLYSLSILVATMLVAVTVYARRKSSEK
ncbi:hypothetical protein [Mogibacterium pumilum]|uniref:FMN-binding domain-containing protein n=1 Tax=Mogibacterium pumilum TaxID=86332 RepID=A0A223ASP3_9FIRM|nr:hypothetical protein [Mogibacterium pumilum]ASS37964.1 hypothetical protein AXF17_05675 [Mogibacterium pumilum]